MAVIRVGVQAVASSNGQTVDLESAFASLATITNQGAESCQYSVNGGSSWATITAGSTASPAVTVSSLLVRKSSLGAYPLPIDVAFTAADGVIGGDGALIALSETTPYVTVTGITAGAAASSTACELAGWYCSVAAGNITIYDALSATGTPIVPATALAVGPMPIFGAGTTGKLALTTGCHVVLSGAATVRVLVA